MKVRPIHDNPLFFGRKYELDYLSKVSNSKKSSILVVYGRRRVGKTELIEQAFRRRKLLKFEGIEGASEAKQKQHFLRQLAEYAQEPYYAKLDLKSWTEIFQLLAKCTAKGKWTIFFDELQWMAAYKSTLIAELKYVWDNFFKKNNLLLLVLCGSSPSFIINKVLHSKALYNRSQHELPLQEFSLQETKAFLGKKYSLREITDAYLTVGGIPEYLDYLKQEPSIFLGLCKHTFTRGGFFLNEYERIFTSSLGSNKIFQRVIEFLSKKRFASRHEIGRHIQSQSGGSLTLLLKDLEACGFLDKYIPFNVSENSLLARYHISDQYLQFYFKFIHPLQKRIHNGDFAKNPTQAMNMDNYNKWLGFSFERFVRKNASLIADRLGFGAVSYRAGVFFNRASIKGDRGFQIDLVFDRADKVYTLCEIKYLKSKATRRVLFEFEEKLRRFSNPKNQTIQKVLISAEGADASLEKDHYFDRVLSLKDFF